MFKPEIKHESFRRSYTIGKLYMNDKLFCDTIEDRARLLPNLCQNTSSNRNCKCKEKVATETAIPAGTYRVTMEYSPKLRGSFHIYMMFHISWGYLFTLVLMKSHHPDVLLLVKIN